MTTLPENLMTRETIEAWLLGFHNASGSLDAERYANDYFTADAEMQYGNNATVKGRQAIQEVFGGAFKGLDYMHHDIEYFDFLPPGKLYQAATVKYVVKGDDPEKDVIVIPAMMTAWLRQEDGAVKMSRVEIFLDPSKVFGRMGEKGLM